MSIRLGDTAPDFTAETTAGLLSFHEWKGSSWAVLFSHPADFTPVCTTELGRTAALSGEFAARNAMPIAVSVDSIEAHHRWIPDIAEVAGVPVDFPIIADQDRAVAQAYDMIHPGEGDTSGATLEAYATERSAYEVAVWLKRNCGVDIPITTIAPQEPVPARTSTTTIAEGGSTTAPPG